jgi:hypothetical protein
MSSFGTKEAWMEPMNAFLTSHRQEFKKYLDEICSISTVASPAPPIPPSYSTPIAILHRLPPTFKEGFPSLPYLIDHSRNFAMLIQLWLENTTKTAHEIQAGDGDLLRFHNICVSLSERTKDCLNRAEPAERPSSALSIDWEELVEKLQGANIDLTRGAVTRNRGAIKEEELEDTPVSPGGLGDTGSSSSATTPVTMRMPSKTRHQQTSSFSASASSLKSNNSNKISYTNPFSNRNTHTASADDSMATSQSASASASASVSAGEETPPGSSDGLHMASAPSYPQTHANASTSTTSFTRSNPAAPINTSRPEILSPDSLSRTLRGVSGYSKEGSESGSMQEEEYTTALPTFSANPTKEKERKERGLRGVLPFQRKKKDKDREKDKDRDKAKEKESRKDKEKAAELFERDSRGRSAMSDAPGTSVMGSLRGKPDRERDDDF